MAESFLRGCDEESDLLALLDGIPSILASKNPSELEDYMSEIRYHADRLYKVIKPIVEQCDAEGRARCAADLCQRYNPTITTRVKEAVTQLTKRLESLASPCDSSTFGETYSQLERAYVEARERLSSMLSEGKSKVTPTAEASRVSSFLHELRNAHRTYCDINTDLEGWFRRNSYMRQARAACESRQNFNDRFSEVTAQLTELHSNITAETVRADEAPPRRSGDELKVSELEVKLRKLTNLLNHNLDLARHDQTDDINIKRLITDLDSVLDSADRVVKQLSQLYHKENRGADASRLESKYDAIIRCDGANTVRSLRTQLASLQVQNPLLPATNQPDTVSNVKSSTTNANFPVHEVEERRASPLKPLPSKAPTSSAVEPGDSDATRNEHIEQSIGTKTVTNSDRFCLSECDLSVKDSLEPSDRVLSKIYDAGNNLSEACKTEMNELHLAQMTSVDLLSGENATLKLARKLCLNRDVLQGTFHKFVQPDSRRRFHPDITFNYPMLKNRFAPLANLLSDPELDENCDEPGDDSSSSHSDSSEASTATRRSTKRKRIKKPRAISETPVPNPVTQPVIPQRRCSSSSVSTRRLNYFSARRRLSDKISKMSDLDTLLYLHVHKLTDRDRKFFAELKSYLTADADQFMPGLIEDATQWLARCIFQNERCDVTLERFVKLYYKRFHHTTAWVRLLSTPEFINNK